MSANAFFWVVPGLFLLFAMAFALVGWHPLGTKGARWAALGYVFGGVGSVVDTQRQYLPGWEVLASPAHWVCVYCMLQSVLTRRNIAMQPWLLAIWIAVAVPLHVYFFYVAPSQFARIIALNSLIPLLIAIALPALIRGHRTAIDNTIATLFTLVMLTYPVRLALYILRRQYVEAGYNWQSSEYVIIFYLAVSALVILVALTIMLATGTDLLAAQMRANRIDPLTGIGNRRALEGWIDLERTTDQKIGAVLMVDLDRFKHVNDSHGHAGGDDLLKGVSRALAAVIEPFGHIARVGGEEFAVLISHHHAEAATSLALAARSAVASVRLADPFSEIRTTASVGLAVRELGESIPEMLKRADLAVYEAKSAGRNVAIRAVGQGREIAFSKAA